MGLSHLGPISEGGGQQTGQRLRLLAPRRSRWLALAGRRSLRSKVGGMQGRDGTTEDCVLRLRPLQHAGVQSVCAQAEAGAPPGGRAITRKRSDIWQQTSEGLRRTNGPRSAGSLPPPPPPPDPPGERETD